ncbi:MAG: helix-turn-helix transcriptional regulator [Bacteroidales bacterium]|nr:helix-turn-helix transcriptional regulator [Bacteroidales bacterium]
MHFFYSKTDGDASDSEILKEFSFLNDFGFEEYKDIRQKPLGLHYNEGIELCYVTKGRYEWVVGDKKYLLFPGNGFVTCPWQQHGSPRDVVDLGEIYWIVIKPELFTKDGLFFLGDWARFSSAENKLIGAVLSKNSKHIIQKAQPLKILFESLHHEIENKKFGYFQRASNLIEEFLIDTVRIIQSKENQIEENKNWFNKFDDLIKANISKKWTLHDLAQMNNFGITTLTHLVKENTGYTPANYIIYLRLEKAKEQLQNTCMSMTNIALDCGFYSSQHFSSTFSRWVGMTPSRYRKHRFNYFQYMSGRDIYSRIPCS